MDEFYAEFASGLEQPRDEDPAEDAQFLECLRLCRKHFLTLATRPLKEEDAINFFNSDVVDLARSRDQRLISHLTSVCRSEMEKQQETSKALRSDFLAEKKLSGDLERQLALVSKQSSRLKAEKISLQTRFLREHIARLTLQGGNRTKVMESAQRQALYILQGMGVEVEGSEDSQEKKKKEMWPNGVRVSTLGEKNTLKEEELKKERERRRKSSSAISSKGQNETTKLRMSLFNSQKQLTEITEKHEKLKEECFGLHKRLQKIAMKKGQEGDDDDFSFDYSNSNMGASDSDLDFDENSPIKTNPNKQLLNKMKDLKSKNSDLCDEVKRLQMQIEMIEHENSTKIEEEQKELENIEKSNSGDANLTKMKRAAMAGGIFIRRLRLRRIKMKKRKARKRFKFSTKMIGLQVRGTSAFAEEARIAVAAAEKAKEVAEKAMQEKVKAEAEKKKAEAEAERVAKIIRDAEEAALKIKSEAENAALKTKQNAEDEASKTTEEARILKEQAESMKINAEKEAAAKTAALMLRAAIKASKLYADAEAAAEEAVAVAKAAVAKANSERVGDENIENSDSKEMDKNGDDVEYEIFKDPATKIVTDQFGNEVNESEFEPGTFEDDETLDMVETVDNETQTEPMEGSANDYIPRNMVDGENNATVVVKNQEKSSKIFGEIPDTDFDVTGFSDSDNEGPRAPSMEASGDGVRAVRARRDSLAISHKKKAKKKVHQQNHSLVGELHQSNSGWSSGHGSGVQFYPSPDGTSKTGYTAYAQIQRQKERDNADSMLKELKSCMLALDSMNSNIAVVRWTSLCLRLNPTPKIQKDPTKLIRMFQRTGNHLNVLLQKRADLKRGCLKVCLRIAGTSLHQDVLLRKGGGYVLQKKGTSIPVPQTQAIEPCCSVVDMGDIPIELSATRDVANMAETKPFYRKRFEDRNNNSKLDHPNEKKRPQTAPMRSSTSKAVPLKTVEFPAHSVMFDKFGKGWHVLPHNAATRKKIIDRQQRIASSAYGKISPIALEIPSVKKETFDNEAELDWFEKGQGLSTKSARHLESKLAKHGKQEKRSPSPKRRILVSRGQRPKTAPMSSYARASTVHSRKEQKKNSVSQNTVLDGLLDEVNESLSIPLVDVNTIHTPDEQSTIPRRTFEMPLPDSKLDDGDLNQVVNIAQFGGEGMRLAGKKRVVMPVKNAAHNSKIKKQILSRSNGINNSYNSNHNISRAGWSSSDDDSLELVHRFLGNLGENNVSTDDRKRPATAGRTRPYSSSSRSGLSTLLERPGNTRIKQRPNSRPRPSTAKTRKRSVVVARKQRVYSRILSRPQSAYARSRKPQKRRNDVQRRAAEATVGISINASSALNPKLHKIGGRNWGGVS